MAIYTDFKEFVQNMASYGQIIAIDWGMRRIGIAISNITQEFAFARETIVQSKTAPCRHALLGDFVATHPASGVEQGPVFDIINSENIVGIIIGLPQYSDGTDSDTTHRIRAFADNLATRTDVPIAFLDEGLSSLAAQERMKADGRVGEKRGLDAYAAAIILEDALAKIKRIRK